MSANDDNDDVFQDMFSSLGNDAPKPDPEFRKKLHAQSLEAFEAAAQYEEESQGRCPMPQGERRTPKGEEVKGISGLTGRRSRVIMIAWRSAVAAAVAACVLVGVWLLAVRSPATATAQPLLSTVLDMTARSKTLHMSIAMPGGTAEAWYAQPGRLRRNDDGDSGRYIIARDGNAWRVDESANRAVPTKIAFLRVEPSSTSASTQGSTTRGGGGKPALDVVAFLGVGGMPDLRPALAITPAERAKRDGVACWIYRANVTIAKGPAKLVANVDAATHLLRSLEITTDRDGKVTPVVKLTVLGVDEPVREELFVVGSSLTEDGRIGKIADAQGVVSIKPVMATRWTPVTDGMLVMPGDWLQTDNRGANCATVRMAGQSELVVGPGSLVELTTAGKLRMSEGEIQIVVGGKSPVDLLGPGDQKAQVKDRGVFRVHDDKLVRLDKDPLWLKSFLGKVVNESIGSLVAKVEGRNVPLTVGYHKVAVDIRDQIARTVVEESFVNTTNGRLEGVFCFPLPQDASISGFGMWIGNDLVEADIVEKQRAREIYEQILRERRDPGLLEWSGGNLFKARVFPIEAHSEKRIKITYTQVLPMRGNAYRYSYALQSDMLKLHPLRELQLDVKLNSVLPLKAVICPTHTARIDQTTNSAHVEFAAQEYTPTRDFEVAVEIDAKQADVAMIPHRRGDDGYFMLMLSAPDAEGNWQREILPDAPADAGQEILLLADTSASMDAAQRSAQAEFIAALLTALGPKDTFNLAGCDVECDWVFGKSMPADAKSIAAARDFLATRTSMGWSDLDKAFTSAMAHCGPKTRVVYVGDGIPTTGAADPAAFVKRLKLLYQGKQGTFYSVSVGSTFESGVLKAIASLGGGSMRQVSGEHDSRAVALELLGEIARPPLRDLKVEFRGLRTARVYPEELPNLPAGSEQILLGRYLPEGADQSGEVVITGTRAGQPVRYSARVSLKDAEQGNSFIPRLWARMHLDFLLAQGSSQAIQDEIVALSEEYHIMTPYTSLLVLESDADRERFKVKRRFLIRDGEKFFAEGRDNANYELVQQQMKRAGAWRLGLRRSVLQQLTNLGRDVQIFQQPLPTSIYAPDYLRDVGGSMTGAEWYNTAGPASSPMGFDTDGNLGVEQNGADASGEWGESGVEWSRAGDKKAKDVALKENESLAADLPADHELSPAEEDAVDMPRASTALPDFETANGSLPAVVRYATKISEQSKSRLRPYAGEGYPSEMGKFDYSTGKSSYRGHYWRGKRGQSPYEYDYTQWLGTLFPAIPAVDKEPALLKDRWPADARAISDSLLRTSFLKSLQGGLTIDQQTDSIDLQLGAVSNRSRAAWLLSTRAWLLRAENDNQQTLVQWCDGKERGVFQKGFGLGRRRAALPDDLGNPPLSFGLYACQSMERSYLAYKVVVKPQGQDQTLLVLTHATSPDYEIRILVDTAKHVVLSVENVSDGKVASTRKSSQFVEVASAWFAGTTETFDEKGRLVSVTTEKFTERPAGYFDLRDKADRQMVQFITEPGRKLSAAKQAAAMGKADFDDQMTLLLHFARSQQWDRVAEHLEAAEKLAVDKPGMRWVRDAVLQISRKHEDLKKRYLAESATLANRAAHLPAGAGDDRRGAPAHDDFSLATYLLGQANGSLSPNEMLALLDTLKPVFECQPAYLRGPVQWNSRRISLLQQVGRNDEALALMKKLADENPRDCSLQLQHAQGLVNAGRLEEAYAWVQRVLVAVEWLPANEESLRSFYADMLYNEGRYAEMVPFVQKWMERELLGTAAYARYLSALIRVDREGDANKLIAQWLKEGQSPERLREQVANRLSAAIAQALGQGHQMNTNRIDERWLAPMADTAIALAKNPTDIFVAEQIMNNSQFVQTDACRRVRKAAVAMLQADSDKLPIQVIQRTLITWITPNDPVVELPVWKQIAAGLHKEWLAAQTPEEKDYLGQLIVQVMSGRVAPDEYLAFLREQVKDGPEGYRVQYVRQLFDTLTVQPWSEKYEDEALALIDHLTDSSESWQRLGPSVQALYALTDRMVPARAAAKMSATTHPEELTRADLLTKQAENLRLARVEFADRLAKEASRRNGPIVHWMTAERLYLNIQAGRDIAKAPGECWEILGPQPRKVELDDHPELVLGEVLRNRMLVMLANLACRKGAQPAQADGLIAYIDQAVAMDAENPQWKLLKYELLIALDRPKDLEAALAGWTRGQDPDHRWTLSLGYLFAEQGKLADAITLFEAVAAVDELGPAEYRSLADWYMAVNRRDAYRLAMIAAYKMAEEWRLSNALSYRLSPWQQNDGKPPAELDEQVLLMFAALFEKSASSQNYLWQLRDYYAATRDFRLLAGLADALIGQTAGKVYPFLQNMSTVLNEVRDEATADSIVECLAKVRQRAKTDVDRRALDLLETMAERRAAELINQPGPHGDKALAALQRAFKRSWSPGEPRLMADVLDSLGTIAYKPLAAEQVRQSEILHRDAAKGSEDRLHIALCLGHVYWNYSRQDEAIDLLSGALGEFEAAHGGVLPASANDVLETYVGYLEQRSHFARGEKVLLEQLKHPTHEQQKLWLVIRLYRLYTSAVGADGEVSLGKGHALYQAAEQKIIADLGTSDQNHRYALVSQLCSLYSTAWGKKLPDVADDLRTFAAKKVPEVLKVQTNNYDSIVSQVADLLQVVASSREALAFLIERIEQERSWFRWNNQDGWSRHSYTLGKLREEVKEIGDLDGRLLKIVLAELRRDLKTGVSRNRIMYHRQQSYFWEAKAADFLAAANEVYAERKGSGAGVAYIAEYLWYGLNAYNRAIEILFIAHKDKLLDEDGQWKLVDFLHQRGRWGESIDLLRAMIEWRPDNLEYRAALMRAYYHTKRPAELAGLLQQTDGYFHKDGRWTESAMATLAKVCLDTALYEPSVTYFKEAIPLHQRTAPRRGIGDGVLSSYYGNMALAFAGLGKTADAVDAACGAIVSWGADLHNRTDAINSLLSVVRQSPKLDELVATLDHQAAEGGLDNPIVRKAVGQVYLERKDFARAIVQLKLASELQPNDAETHKALVACCDEQKDKDGAIWQILQSLQLMRRDLTLYADLGSRYTALERPKEAERAYTSIVEALPSESESHAMLAEIRQQQDRWPEAVIQWEQVVRIRALEPTGLLKLAQAQLHLKQWDSSAETIRKLRAKAWPSRFGDVDSQVRELERQLEAGRK